MRRARLVTFWMLLMAVSLLAASSAGAAYPGRNGPIVFKMAGDIWAVNGDGGGLRRVTRFADNESDPVVSPNGRLLAFRSDAISGEGEQIFVTDLKGKKPRWITKDFTKGITWGSFYWPMWSKDGKRLIFGCNHRPRGYQLCSTELKPKKKKKRKIKLLTNCKECFHGESNPADASGQNRIAFAGGLTFDYIATLGSGGGTPNVIFRQPTAGDFLGEVSWSPSGGELAFEMGSPGSLTIQAIDSSGGNRRVILGKADGSYDPDNFQSPAWAPDGTRLVVLARGSYDGGVKPGLYTVDPNNPQDLSAVFLDELGQLDQYADPNWGPAPK